MYKYWQGGILVCHTKRNIRGVDKNGRACKRTIGTDSNFPNCSANMVSSTCLKQICKEIIELETLHSYSCHYVEIDNGD